MNNRKKQSHFGKILLILVIFVLLIAIGVNTYVFKSVKQAIGPASPRLSILTRFKVTYAMFKQVEALKLPKSFGPLTEVKFTVQDGEGVSQICQRLESEGIVQNGKVLCDYLIYSGKDRSIQPGSYTIANLSSTVNVGNRLGDPKNRDIPLFIFAGWRIEEVANAIDQYPLPFDGTAFLNTVRQPSQTIMDKLGLKPGSSLEGYILPGTYNLKPGISLEQAVEIMVERFNETILNSTLKTQIESHGLSLQEGLTLASIIQRETLATEEMPTMASVFYNRLRLGMKLETDVSVQYAVGWYAPQNTWWKGPLTWDDLAVNSLYNTYQVHGLPPGPLCSAAMAAIEAVAQPAVSDYLFFRAACDGSGRHNFAITYEEHLQNGCE